MEAPAAAMPASGLLKVVGTVGMREPASPAGNDSSSKGRTLSGMSERSADAAARTARTARWPRRAQGAQPARRGGAHAVGSVRFARLERQAVRELSEAASTHGCSQMREVVGSVRRSSVRPSATGRHRHGVAWEAVSYSAPAPSWPHRSSTIGAILGADIPEGRKRRDSRLAAADGAGLGVSVVVAYAAGQGPRNEQVATSA